MCVCARAHRCVHSWTCSICENSVRNKNPASCTSPCVCVCVCVWRGRVCVCKGTVGRYVAGNNGKCVVHVHVLCEISYSILAV